MWAFAGCFSMSINMWSWQSQACHLFCVDVLLQKQGCRDGPTKAPSEVSHVSNRRLALLPVVIFNWHWPKLLTCREICMSDCNHTLMRTRLSSKPQAYFVALLLHSLQMLQCIPSDSHMPFTSINKLFLLCIAHSCLPLQLHMP